MGKKLAIKGHPTRGKEVIELLEMMGGCECGYCGGGTDFYYYISQFGNIEGSSEPYEFDTYIVYTLEEFLEKYPFKVGDKVIDEADGCPGVVCEMKWDEGLSDMKYCVAFGNGIDFGWYANDSINFFKIKKNENSEENKFPSFEPMFKLNDELEYKIPDGYEITEVSKDTVFIKPIKPKIPTTYKECCDVLKIPNDERYIDIDVPLDYNKLLFVFTELLICRKTYYKIAGEQMGLGKPWEPENLSKHYNFTIETKENQIICNAIVTTYKNRILSFPTPEMRDAFYENFKKEIEICKEFL